MESVPTPLNDAIADLRPGDGSDPGEVRRRVDYELDDALELFMDYRDGAPALIVRAAEHVGEAIATLEHYRERLERLAG